MARAGAQAFTTTYPVRYKAIINNPLTIPYTNEAVGIRVRFPRGLVPTADYFRVQNDSGSFIPFQWEPSTEPINGTFRGLWPDNTLREGTIWVMVPSLTALQEITYNVLIYATAQGQSFTQAVTYSVSGSDDRFDTARIQIDFMSSKQYQPGRYRDKNAASENLFNGVQGGFAQYQVSSGVTRSSFTPTDVASNTRTRLGTSNFGNGVVYQELQIDWTWNPETTVACRERYRVWANGSVTRETYHYTTGVIASAAKRMVANIQTENTGMTGTYDPDRCYKEFVWSNKQMINGVRTVSFQYPAATTEVHASNFDGTTNNNQQIWGWQGTTSMPNGAFFYQLSFFDLAYAAGDGLNQWTRRFNPIYTTATPFQIGQLREQMMSMAIDIIDDWVPLAAADATNAYSGTEVLCRLTQDAVRGTNQRAACLAEIQAWGVSRGITLTSAASYVTAWNGGLGWEFIGKVSEAYPWLRKAFRSAGDTANANTVETYIHALADAVVTMEVSSGGGGQMKLDGPGADNYNAETSAMMSLANSLELVSNATRLATFNRIANRYSSGYFGQCKIGYSADIPGTPSQNINAARSIYYTYSGFEQWLTSKTYPLPAPPQHMRQYTYEFISASSIELAWQYQYQQTRRGFPGTAMASMFCFGYGHESDWQWIVNAMEYFYSKRRPGRFLQFQLENLTGTDGDETGSGVGVRGLCEMILRAKGAYQ